MLFEYLKQVQRLMRDGNQTQFNPQDLIEYVNRARRQVAIQAQCIRVIPPTAGQIQTITVTNGGSGYIAPTVTITGPDSPSGAIIYPNGAQALAHATVVAGVITDIQVDFGGDGYFQPQVFITDAHGTGATTTVQTTPINITAMGQEIYSFADIPLQNFPGVKGVLNVRSISVIFANWRYSCLRYPFQQYQAYIRRYPQNYQYVPEVFAQVGDGSAGKLFGYPIANGAYRMEFDCICLPIDLLTDDSVEAIPEPWTDAVPFLACYYAYLELANLNAARFYKGEYDNFVSRYSAGARPGAVSVNPYGRA